MSSATSFFDLKAATPKGPDYDFNTLKGKVTLIVNTATACGFTPQFTGLEALHQKYKDQGLVVLGFPCNGFGGQNPGTDAETESFCVRNHGVTFPLMKTSEVNGDNANPVFKYLKEKKKTLGVGRVLWNFEFFVVDRDGKVVERYRSLTTPQSIDGEIKKLLDQPAKL